MEFHVVFHLSITDRLWSICTVQISPINLIRITHAAALISHDIRAGSVADAVGHQLADESADGFHDFFFRFGLLS